MRLTAPSLRLTAEPAGPTCGNAHHHSFDAPVDATAERSSPGAAALRVEEQLSSDTLTLLRRVRVAAAAALITAEALPERLNTPLRALMGTLKHEPRTAHAEKAWLRVRRLALSFGFSRPGFLPTMLVRQCHQHVRRKARIQSLQFYRRRSAATERPAQWGQERRVCPRWGQH